MPPGSRLVARLTGLAYLGMLPTGLAGFMVIRSRLVDPESATATVTHLLENSELARIGLLCIMGLIVAQALAAVGFYALFRDRQPVAGFATAAFGLMNAAAILGGAAASWAGLELAESAGMDAARTVSGAVRNRDQRMAAGQPVLWPVADSDGVGGVANGLVSPEHGARLDPDRRRRKLRAGGAARGDSRDGGAGAS